MLMSKEATPGGPAATNPSSTAPTVSNHPYAHVLDNAPSSYYSYEELEIDWGTPEPYEVHQKIGRGKYSEVFTGTNRINGSPCVVKVLKPVKEKKFQRELLILTHLSGVPNVVTLYDMVRDPETDTPALIFELVQNTNFRQLYPTFTDKDVKHYMYELCRTLDVTHAMGIFHRDIKPHNLCIDHARRLIRLIDWGLAEFYLHNVPLNVRVASRYYKGPELLIGYRKYDYSLDIWSLGCVFAAIVFGVETLFQGQDNEDQLMLIVKALGTADVVQYCRKTGMPVPSFLAAAPVYPKRPWTSFVGRDKQGLASADALDLIDKMLVVDHTMRITAADALRHRYFDSVRGDRAAAASPTAGGVASPPAVDAGGSATAVRR